MNYKKIGLIILTLITIIGVMLLIRKKQSSIKDDITIGILQTASHPSLDQAREGFATLIKKRFGNDVNFIIQNAQGSIVNAHAIAQRFHANNDIKAIYAIATPAAQAIATVEKEKPIIVAAVSDITILPDQLNICGVSDMIDMHKLVDMIHQLAPTIKTIALLYNNAEANSIVQVNLIKNELKKIMIHSLEVGIAQESDIPTAVSMACRNADALICPAHNTLASAIELVASIALTNQKPLFACYNQAVIQGALAAYGVDYKNSGEQAGELAFDILIKNKSPHDLPIEKSKTKIYINKKTLTALALTVPETLKDVVISNT